MHVDSSCLEQLRDLPKLFEKLVSDDDFTGGSYRRGQIFNAERPCLYTKSWHDPCPHELISQIRRAQDRTTCHCQFFLRW